MSDPRTNSEFQDVLSSIRRLISEDRSAEPRPAGKLVLTAEHRIEALAVARQTPEAPAAAPATVEAWQADVHAEVRALSVGARTVDEASATLEDTIAELEAAVAQTGEDFEPDGGEEALSRGLTDPALEGAFGDGFGVDEAAEAEDAAETAGLDLPITGDGGHAEPDAANGPWGEATPATERSGEAPAERIGDAAGAVPASDETDAQDMDRDAAPDGGLPAGDHGDAVADRQDFAPAGTDHAGDAAGAEARAGSAATPDTAAADLGTGDTGPADAGFDGTGGTDFDVALPDHPATAAKMPGAEGPEPADLAHPAFAAAATSRIRRLNLASAGEDIDAEAETPAPWASDANRPLLSFAHGAHAGAEAEAEDDEPGLFDEGDETVIDMETLRELVADIIRQELQGPLGERITRNVRKLVRREINRALDGRIAEAGDEG